MTTEGNTTFPRGDERGGVSQKNKKETTMCSQNTHLSQRHVKENLRM